jgi:hypothetical protein
MLEQTIDWTQTAGTIAEAIVLLRMLLLRLPRVYTFITLYWAVNLIFDASAWSFGWHSQVTTRIAVNESFVLAILMPFAVWDAFEEFRPSITKIRRVYLSRLFSGLLFTSVLGLILAMGAESSSDNAGPAEFLGLFLWLGSAMSSLLFTWNVFRATKRQSLSLPRNTYVWCIFFLVTLSRAILDFVLSFLGVYLGQPALGVIQLLLLCVDLVITLWCLLKLRSSEAGTTGAPEQASL